MNGFTNFSRGVVFKRGFALQAAGLFGNAVRIGVEDDAVGQGSSARWGTQMLDDCLARQPVALLVEVQTTVVGKRISRGFNRLGQ